MFADFFFSMKCGWNCEHHKCTKLCHEPCDRPPCNEPCPKVGTGSINSIENHCSFTKKKITSPLVRADKKCFLINKYNTYYAVFTTDKRFIQHFLILPKYYFTLCSNFMKDCPASFRGNLRGNVFRK